MVVCYPPSGRFVVGGDGGAATVCDVAISPQDVYTDALGTYHARMKRLFTLVLSGLVLVVSAASVWAQSANPAPPPKAPAFNLYPTYGLMALFIILILIISFKPSKRSHQD